jgi:hypothetical protein
VGFVRVAWIVSGALLLGCGGSEPTADVQPTLADLQSAVFTPACATSGCHDAATAAGELDLSTTSRSYEGMVGVPSRNRVAKENAWLMIKPGEPERSFLVRKLDGPGLGEGDPMPSETEMLSAYYRNLVVQWIAEGAAP